MHRKRNLHDDTANRGGLEPVAAVRDPPRNVENRNGRGQRPPQRQDQVRDQPQHKEGGPEDFSLHALIVKRGEDAGA